MYMYAGVGWGLTIDITRIPHNIMRTLKLDRKTRKQININAGYTIKQIKVNGIFNGRICFIKENSTKKNHE